MTNIPATPFENAYWVRPGQVLAGEYPGSRTGYVFRTEDVVRERMRALVEFDINVIIDLSKPGEGEDYRELLRQEARRHNVKVEHVRMPIKDMGVPTEDEMAAILDRIDQALIDNLAVYVHCMAGIGRTGMVIGCHLVRHGIPADQAIACMNELRKHMPYGKYLSPETETQAQFILGWKAGQ